MLMNSPIQQLLCEKFSSGMYIPVVNQLIISLLLYSIFIDFATKKRGGKTGKISRRQFSMADPYAFIAGRKLYIYPDTGR